MFDPILLARIQFAFTISFHILFPAFTIGLASYLAVLEFNYLRTKNETYKEIYLFLVKIFAITFGMGVVSGIVMSYEFGTNWSGFSRKFGNVLGPLLSFEVLTAFFLEASFLGIMLFGWSRVSKKMHFAATLIVAIGTLISAFWILSANSWMQTPQGFEVIDGVFYPINWFAIIFNSSFPYRFLHMVLACYLTTATTICGISAWFLWQQKNLAQARIMFKMSIIFIAIFVPLQIFVGDLHGLNTLKYQPAKIAAMEGIWENEKGAGLKVFGIPDQVNRVTKYSIEIPKLASVILKHDANAEIIGLNSFEEIPPVAPVFFAFRIMVGIGFLMLILGIFGAILNWRKKLFEKKWLQIFAMLMTPMGFIALLAGWFVTEIGRQPYVAYGLVKTNEIASVISSTQVLISLISFIVVYFIIFGAATYYILRLIVKAART